MNITSSLAVRGSPWPTLLEPGGGLARLAGYRARLISWLLSAFPIVTAVIFHNKLSDQLQMILFLKITPLPEDLCCWPNMVQAFTPGQDLQKIVNVYAQTWGRSCDPFYLFQECTKDM